MAVEPEPLDGPEPLVGAGAGETPRFSLGGRGLLPRAEPGLGAMMRSFTAKSYRAIGIRVVIKARGSGKPQLNRDGAEV